MLAVLERSNSDTLFWLGERVQHHYDGLSASMGLA